ncbi:MAG: ankyrin repeat domain-containing protein [Chloroflexi bacterium]|jgi:ankyrin repeat protein|nr:ankyrin repeat domain-containing protein [Chloroflexota bacterium]MBT3862731.1 ankyrin repeat domain-containing protein [Chloroflexota bacterium]MBT5894144.1 ankyrin repeat domain-containing protein [Chloroflexota bacterium]
MSKRFLLTLILSGVMALVLSGCSADIEAMDSDGQTPLHLAALSNSLDAARLLIDSDADIEAKESNGETPLDSAVSNNSLDVARLLIDHGANTEGVDLSWMD